MENPTTNCNKIRDAIWPVYCRMLHRYSVLDHVLFILTLAYVCFTYEAKQWISFLLFFAILYDCRESLLTYEVFYISLSLERVGSCIKGEKVLYVTHALLLDEKNSVLHSALCLLKVQLLFECNIAKEVTSCILQVMHSPVAFAKLSLQALICAALQVIMSKHQCVNTKRKMFHFFAFLSFVRRSLLVVHIGHLVLLLFILLQDNRKLVCLYRPFLSHRDYGERVYSHILLLGSVLYPAVLLKADSDYHLVMISICFLDSFASIAGRCAGHRKKSLIGLLCGFFAGNIVYFLMYHSFLKWRYFVLASLLEYFVMCNDNIVLPLFSVFFLKNTNSGSWPVAFKE